VTYWILTVHLVVLAFNYVGQRGLSRVHRLNLLTDNIILEASQAGSRERVNFQQKIMRTPKLCYLAADCGTMFIKWKLVLKK
jgi:hypothetical protein